jgi:hypothetical protein
MEENELFSILKPHEECNRGYMKKDKQTFVLKNFWMNGWSSKQIHEASLPDSATMFKGYPKSRSISISSETVI